MRKYSLVLLKEEIIMLETAMQMEKKMDEMVHLVTAQIGAEDILSIDSDTFAVLKASLELIDISKKMMVEQAKTIDEMNRKLDVILEK
jgi:hypothetical protein